MEQIKFAVIGCGHIGKRHAEMINGNSATALAAMIDAQPKDNLDIGKYEVPFFQSFEELVESEIEFDVVCVCTPNGLHASQCIQALKAGKHVVCEKPMALTKADCEEVIYTALQAARHVFVVMQNRYSPPSVWLKEVVEKKIIGDVYMVQLNCYWNRDDRYYKNDGWKGKNALDGGTLFTQFSHFVDIMYWLFGDISNIQGKFNDFCHQQTTEFEDSGFVSFDFVKGGMGTLNYSTAVWGSNLESSMTIIGSKGSIRVGGQYMNEVEYCNIENYEMPDLPPANPPNDYGPYKGSAANHHYIYENVVETLNNSKFATTNALEGMKVVEIIERIYSLRDQKYVSKVIE